VAAKKSPPKKPAAPKRQVAKPGTLAHEVFREHLEQVAAHVERNGVRGMRALYEDAREQIKRRLRQLGPADKRVEATTLRAQLAQVDAVLSLTGDRLRKHLTDLSATAAQLGADHGVAEFKLLAKKFRGTEPRVNLDQSAVFRGLVRGQDPSLLGRHRQASQTWSLSAIKTVERELSTSAMLGKPLHKVIDDVEDALGTERWKAERIVRTEGSYAANLGKLTAMEESGATHKRIVETFDDRTGDDSFLVHGQTVKVDAAFNYKRRSKGGKWIVVAFMHPPNRPNDRASVIPWDPDWDDDELTRPLTRAELIAAVPTRWRSTVGVEIPPGHRAGKRYPD
jgi:hypothetical protein